MKERNKIYEKKFRTYLFSFDLDTHKEICKNLNVKPNTSQEKEQEQDLKAVREDLKILIKRYPQDYDLIQRLENCIRAVEKYF